MTINLSPTQAVAALGVLLALSMMWRSGTRRGRRAADAAHGASRVASLAGHLLGTAGVIIAVQWVAITYAPGSTLFWVVLAVPERWGWWRSSATAQPVSARRWMKWMYRMLPFDSGRHW